MRPYLLEQYILNHGNSSGRDGRLRNANSLSGWQCTNVAGQGHTSKCVLCDQVEEDIQHILIGCVFSKQVWFQMLSKVGLSVLTSQAADTSFEDWRIKIDKLAPTVFRKGINSLIILGALMIWKQRNDCVFTGRRQMCRES